MTSRNDLCWCGSQQKYKTCHLEFDEKLDQLKRKGYVIPARNLIKTAEQIEKIRQSATITRGIFAMLEPQIQEGVTTNQIDQWVYEYTIQKGGIPAPLNYQGFPKSVCTSLNQVICHGIPDETSLKKGDIINVDVTTILDGYYSDASRMFLVGEISEVATKLVDTAFECLRLGIEQVLPFTPLKNIGRAIEPYAKQNGFSVVRDFGGHGIGNQFHEEPFISHYNDRNEAELIALPGMVFTIEPMINEGGHHCKILADGWTAVTRDGKLSAQWEHTVLVTDTGVEILT